MELPLRSSAPDNCLVSRTCILLDGLGEPNSMVNDPVLQVLHCVLTTIIWAADHRPDFFFHYRYCAWKTEEQAEELLRTRLHIPTLTIHQFRHCGDSSAFFRKVRTAIVRRQVELVGEPNDLSSVLVTLKDKDVRASRFNWQVSMSAEDLRQMAKHIGEESLKEDSEDYRRRA